MLIQPSLYNMVQDYTARPEIKELLPEAISMAQKWPLCRDCCLRLALHTFSSARQKKEDPEEKVKAR